MTEPIQTTDTSVDTAQDRYAYWFLDGCAHWYNADGTVAYLDRAPGHDPEMHDGATDPLSQRFTPPKSPIETLLATCPPIEPARALHLAADCLASELAWGAGHAIQLSDLFADAGVRLPLLNWPTPALRPLEVSS